MSHSKVYDVQTNETHLNEYHSKLKYIRIRIILLEYIGSDFLNRKYSSPSSQKILIYLKIHFLHHLRSFFESFDFQRIILLILTILVGCYTGWFTKYVNSCKSL